MGAGISDVELGSWKFFVSKVYTGLGGSGSDLASRIAGRLMIGLVVLLLRF